MSRVLGVLFSIMNAILWRSGMNPVSRHQRVSTHMTVMILSTFSTMEEVEGVSLGERVLFQCSPQTKSKWRKGKMMRSRILTPTIRKRGSMTTCTNNPFTLGIEERMSIF